MIVCVIVQENNFLPVSKWMLKPLVVSLSSDIKLIYTSLPVELTSSGKMPVSAAISGANALSPSYTYTKSYLEININTNHRVNPAALIFSLGILHGLLKR